MTLPLNRKPKVPCPKCGHHVDTDKLSAHLVDCGVDQDVTAQHQSQVSNRDTNLRETMDDSQHKQAADPWNDLTSGAAGNCPTCKGAGQIASGMPCPNCNGTGYTNVPQNPANNVGPYSPPQGQSSTSTLGPSTNLAAYKGDPGFLKKTPPFEGDPGFLNPSPPFSGDPGFLKQPHNADQTDPSFHVPSPFDDPDDINPFDDKKKRPPWERPMTVSSVQDTDAEDIPDLYERFSKQEGWFDGTTATIYDRIQIASALQKRIASVLSGPVSDVEFTALHEASDSLKQEIETLGEVAKEYDTSHDAEYLASLPGGTIARDYTNLIDGGLVDLGPDDGSWLYAEAAKVQKEAANYDWDEFVTVGAEQWMVEKAVDSPEMLKHEVVTRQAAVDHARDKTMVLLDAEKRAGVIDAFVTNVEKLRRQAARKLAFESSRQHEAAIRGTKIDGIVEDILNGDAEVLWW